MDIDWFFVVVSTNHFAKKKIRNKSSVLKVGRSLLSCRRDRATSSSTLNWSNFYCDNSVDNNRVFSQYVVLYIPIV